MEFPGVPWKFSEVEIGCNILEVEVWWNSPEV